MIYLVGILYTIFIDAIDTERYLLDSIVIFIVSINTEMFLRIFPANKYNSLYHI